MPEDYFLYSVSKPNRLGQVDGSAEETPSRRARIERALRGLKVRWKAKTTAWDLLVPHRDDVRRKFEQVLRDEVRLYAGHGVPVRVWTRKEIESARWHAITYGFDPDYRAGQDHDNRFDFTSGCEACFRGKRYLPPVRTDVPQRFDRAMHQLIGFDWLVNDQTKTALLNEDVRGFRFLPIESAKAGTVLEHLWLVEPDEIGPSLDPTSPFVSEVECRECGLPRSSLCEDQDSWLAYGRSDLDGLQTDVFWTNEIFGRGWSAWRGLVVSRRVRDVLRRLRVRGIEYRPVTLA